MTSPSSGGAVMSSASITHGASSGVSEGAGLGGGMAVRRGTGVIVNDRLWRDISPRNDCAGSIVPSSNKPVLRWVLEVPRLKEKETDGVAIWLFFSWIN